MKLQYLGWDTDFFGLKTGKIEIIDENDFDAAEFNRQATDEKYELIYVFAYGSMLGMQSIGKAGLELADIMLTLSKKFDKSNYIHYPYEFRKSFTPEEIEDFYFIAEETSIVSRFFKEEKIGPEKARKLYRKWIDNAINSSFTDGLFLVKDGTEVAGIHLIKTDEKEKTGHCSLIGVDPRKKGMGIGKKLWEQSFGYWANEKDINLCKVPFSIKNYESFNFHMKMGFSKIEEVKYIYHWKNN